MPGRAAGACAPASRPSPTAFSPTQPSQRPHAQQHGVAIGHRIAHEHQLRRHIGLQHTAALKQQMLQDQVSRRVARAESRAEERELMTPAPLPWEVPVVRQPVRPAPWAVSDAPRRGRQGRRGSDANRSRDFGSSGAVGAEGGETTARHQRGSGGATPRHLLASSRDSSETAGAIDTAAAAARHIRGLRGAGGLTGAEADAWVLEQLSGVQARLEADAHAQRARVEAMAGEHGEQWSDAMSTASTQLEELLGGLDSLAGGAAEDGGAVVAAQQQQQQQQQAGWPAAVEDAGEFGPRGAGTAMQSPPAPLRLVRHNGWEV
jgi:hypothetical protein